MAERIRSVVHIIKQKTTFTIHLFTTQRSWTTTNKKPLRTNIGCLQCSCIWEVASATVRLKGSQHQCKGKVQPISRWAPPHKGGVILGWVAQYSAEEKQYAYTNHECNLTSKAIYHVDQQGYWSNESVASPRIVCLYAQSSVPKMPCKPWRLSGRKRLWHQQAPRGQYTTQFIKDREAVKWNPLGSKWHKHICAMYVRPQ